ncbi:hypothetical protein BD289DRAFT_132358 [Coniella lustricola]|uniref:Uncharacterized protein n=1 Tax=Coniella lustricola TaxID=2025994 RepID=A0A2T2ZVX0_9PEZI|nr:hypothetical protein BD289DRAFT_132358 [Coniella lustricola]
MVNPTHSIYPRTLASDIDRGPQPGQGCLMGLNPRPTPGRACKRASKRLSKAHAPLPSCRACTIARGSASTKDPRRRPTRRREVHRLGGGSRQTGQGSGTLGDFGLRKFGTCRESHTRRQRKRALIDRFGQWATKREAKAVSLSELACAAADWLGWEAGRGWASARVFDWALGRAEQD